MSTIKVDNIRIASESVNRPVTGVAAAWVNYQGSGTPTIRSSLNVSTATETANGISTYSLTTPMSGDQTQFSFAASAMSTSLNRFVVGNSDTTTSSVIGTLRGDPSDGRLVSGPISWSIHGELA